MGDLDTTNLNLLWASLVMEALVRQGIHQVFISPGSRSTPLVVAAARHPQITIQVCYDERGAAFQALGYAKALCQPVVLICTSGTAGANYYPAVIEAAQERIPLLILTADRPPELQETGANQTIHQSDFYGNFAKWRFNFPCPDLQIPASMVLTTMDQGIHQARQAPAGPVHLNCMFREPLEPQAQEVPFMYLEPLNEWLQHTRPFSHYFSGHETLAKKSIAQVGDWLNQTRTGLLIVGRLQSPREIKAVKRLSQVLKWPIFADILSGLRLDAELEYLLPYYDLLLNNLVFQEICRPTTILHLGEPVLSQRLLRHLNQYHQERYIHVSNHPFRRDPSHHISERIQADIAVFCQQLTPLLHSEVNQVWLQTMENKGAIVESLAEKWIDREETLSEPSIARVISQLTPSGSNLFLANSMPVREMDMFGQPCQEKVRIIGNRGTSGIDGNLATAIGLARATGQLTTLLIGDLALLHDMNSLCFLQSLETPLLIVVVNNGGGGIFSFLPIANYADVFEPYFGTPHAYNFAALASMFQLQYAHPYTRSEFVLTYQKAIEAQAHILIELRTQRQENQRFHRQFLEYMNHELMTPY